MSPFEALLQQEKIAVERDAVLAPLTSFHIGGKADYFVSVTDAKAVETVLRAAKQTATPLFVLGNGSNLLVSDRGIRGAVLHLKGNRITREENTLTAFAGTSLSALCIEAQKAGLSGLEFAFGIPGSVGGAVFMNAGAYGGEMANVLKTVTFLDENGAVQTLPAKELQLGYRTSVFKQNGAIILSAAVELSPDSPENIKQKMDDFLARRKEKQPLEWPSAGSTFKRPEGHFAGALIEQCGLKGLAVGDAAVSEKHAGFIINKGKATARDVRQLIETVRRTVLRQTGVLLEPEVLAVGQTEEDDVVL